MAGREIRWQDVRLARRLVRGLVRGRQEGDVPVCSAAVCGRRVLTPPAQGRGAPGMRLRRAMCCKKWRGTLVWMVKAQRGLEFTNKF